VPRLDTFLVNQRFVRKPTLLAAVAHALGSHWCFPG
jgi:hypothetical protein